MIKREERIKKEALKVSIKLVVIQITIIVFFTITWLSSLIFGIGVFNVWYFLFMFIGIIISSLIVLYSKGNPDQPIPKKLTQQLSNLLKDITDILTIDFVGKEMGIKDIIQNALVWSLREAKISPEFDKKTLEEAGKYMFDKLSEKRE